MLRFSENNISQDVTQCRVREGGGDVPLQLDLKLGFLPLELIYLRLGRLGSVGKGDVILNDGTKK